MPFLPIRRLRAQHFVRAFEGPDGVSATARAYAPSLTQAARFTERDLAMDWALAELRKRGGAFWSVLGAGERMKKWEKTWVYNMYNMYIYILYICLYL